MKLTSTQRRVAAIGLVAVFSSLSNCAIVKVAQTLCEGQTTAACVKINKAPASIEDAVRLGKDEYIKQRASAPVSDPDQLRVQVVLEKYQCPVGKPDGAFGPKSQVALAKFGTANPDFKLPLNWTYSLMADILEARDDWKFCSALPTSAIDQMFQKTLVAEAVLVALSATPAAAVPAFKM